MKQIILILLSQLIMAGSMLAQSGKVTIKGEKVTGREIYLDLDGKDIGFFIEKESSITNVDKKTFSLTKSPVNIFFKWRNPLFYKLTWSDSVYADEQQEAVKNFVKLLLPLFNVPATDDTKAITDKSQERMSNAQVRMKPFIRKDRTAPTAILDRPEGLKDENLVLLYLMLIANQKNSLTDDEINSINKFTVLLNKLVKVDIDLHAGVAKNFKDLVAITDAEKVNELVQKVTNNVDSLKKTLQGVDTYRQDVRDAAKAISIADELTNTYFHTVIDGYLGRSDQRGKDNQSLLTLLGPVIDVLKKSAPPDENIRRGAIPGYYRARVIDLEEDKDLHTKLVVSKYKLSADNLAFEKSADEWKAMIDFKSYDPFSISVSTGLFYGSTNIRGFGTSPAGTGQMTVTDDTLKNSSAVAAVFCNVNLGVGSRFFSPLIQLGVDPTKKHPFFLAGGGFYIPVAHFALTAGGIWTFEPELKTLKVGQTISSTTDLEKDIKNNLKLSPKGWYLGIQYNF